MAKKKEEKQKYGDIIENHDLIKRTLMVAAYPALITSEVKDGTTFYKGFLPGFEFASISEVETEDECVEYLQDMLDDEVEELVVFGKSLPNVDEDEKLLKDNPNHKIVYLDINVYATKEELDYYDNCTHNCSSCGGHCGEEDFFDDCDDDDCGCGHHHCDCEDDDCNCEDYDDCEDCCDDDCDCNDDCDDDCCCGGEHHHHHDESCSCHGENNNKTCSCGEHKHENNSDKLQKNCDHKHKENCCGKGDGSCKKNGQKTTKNTQENKNTKK